MYVFWISNCSYASQVIKFITHTSVYLKRFCFSCFLKFFNLNDFWKTPDNKLFIILLNSFKNHHKESADRKCNWSRSQTILIWVHVRVCMFENGELQMGQGRPKFSKKFVLVYNEKSLVIQFSENHNQIQIFTFSSVFACNNTTYRIYTI